MSQFALLLHHAPDRYHNLSEEEAGAVFKDYMDWMTKHMESGICVAGNKLLDQAGVSLKRSGRNIEIHESPFIELAEILGGYMIIEADSLDDAVRIAKTHPHLKHNSHIEVKALAH